MHRDLQRLIGEIEGCSVKRPSRGRSVELRASDAKRYTRGLADSPRAAFTRHLLSAAGSDERRLFRWRLEHKLLQALLIEHYAPGTTPPARGVFEFLAGAGRGPFRAALADAVESGWIIKRTIGYCAGLDRSLSVGEEALAAIEAGEISLRRSVPIVAEHALLQRRVAIRNEYRVHSFDRRVVETVTYDRHPVSNRRRVRRAIAFVRSVLDRLPDAVVAGSFLAWDVARQHDGRFVIIEVNVAGVHPPVAFLRAALDRVPPDERPARFCRPGFQCSGYFHEPVHAALPAARLVRHLEQHEGMRITVRMDVDVPAPESELYGEVIEWLDAFDDPLQLAAKRRRAAAAK